jgi:hypothetical protein
MKNTKGMLVTVVLGLAGLMAIPAAAQNGSWNGNNRNGGWQDRDHGNYNNGSQNKAYQQGYKDGVWDTQHGPQQRSRNWSNDSDARAYRDGYNAGYRGNGAYNGGYNNNRGGRWGSWSNNNGRYNTGYGGSGNYAQQGFIDGQNDGSRDRQTGHSFRPTEQPGWKHADRGYNGGVSKDQYKQMYRDAYMQGYQRGYYGR